MTDLSSHCVQGWSMPLSFTIHQVVFCLLFSSKNMNRLCDLSGEIVTKCFKSLHLHVWFLTTMVFLLVFVQEWSFSSFFFFALYFSKCCFDLVKKLFELSPIYLNLHPGSKHVYLYKWLHFWHFLISPLCLQPRHSLWPQPLFAVGFCLNNIFSIVIPPFSTKLNFSPGSDAATFFNIFRSITPGVLGIMIGAT